MIVFANRAYSRAVVGDSRSLRASSHRAINSSTLIADEVILPSLTLATSAAS